MNIEEMRIEFEKEFDAMSSFIRSSNGSYVCEWTRGAFAGYMAGFRSKKSLMTVDVPVIRASYDFTIGTDLHVYGLTVGDHGYEDTGIVISPDCIPHVLAAIKTSLHSTSVEA